MPTSGRPHGSSTTPAPSWESTRTSSRTASAPALGAASDIALRPPRRAGAPPGRLLQRHHHPRRRLAPRRGGRGRRPRRAPRRGALARRPPPADRVRARPRSATASGALPFTAWHELPALLRRPRRQPGAARAREPVQRRQERHQVARGGPGRDPHDREPVGPVPGRDRAGPDGLAGRRPGRVGPHADRGDGRAGSSVDRGRTSAARRAPSLVAPPPGRPVPPDPRGDQRDRPRRSTGTVAHVGAHGRRRAAAAPGSGARPLSPAAGWLDPRPSTPAPPHPCSRRAADQGPAALRVTPYGGRRRRRPRRRPRADPHGGTRDPRRPERGSVAVSGTRSRQG